MNATYIELPILFHSSTTSELANCNVEFKLSKCTVSEIPFFRIDVLVPFRQDNVLYTQVFSGGQLFYSTLTVDEILDMIDESFETKFMIYEN